MDQLSETTIRNIWKEWLSAKGYTERSGQWEMIKTIFLNLQQTHRQDHAALSCCSMAIEAPTGIGKTGAYLLAALPIAIAGDYKLIIATSTTALQQQLLNKELPSIKKYTDLRFDFAIAKGRGRYLCLQRSAGYTQTDDSADNQPSLIDELATTDLSPALIALYTAMHKKALSLEWDGDLDSWQDEAQIPLEAQNKQNLIVTSKQCTSSDCAWYTQCCYYRARNKVMTAKCVVTNHALVAADLHLGGGVLLPELKNSIYIFDEAHSLSRNICTHFGHEAILGGEQHWLPAVTRSLEQLRELLTHSPLVERNYATRLNFDTEFNTLNGYYANLLAYFRNFSSEPNVQQGNYDTPYCLLPTPLAKTLCMMAKQAHGLCHDIAERLTDMRQWLHALGEEHKTVWPDSAKAINMCLLFGGYLESIQTELCLWSDYAKESIDELPVARWYEMETNGSTCVAYSRPLVAEDILSTTLWADARAVVMTSATLTIDGSFDWFRRQLGLAPTIVQQRIDYCFDYANQAELLIPDLSCTPLSEENHSAAIINYIPQTFGYTLGTLVLFTNRRQMIKVYDALLKRGHNHLLLQDSYSMQALIAKHCACIDAGYESVIFGLMSFSEGVDLVGNYCGQVIIAKLNFPVPGTPEMQTWHRWCDLNDMNAFKTVALPYAILRLAQACGRLLRDESDHGRIVLLDSRVKTKHYGKTILKSLPPYKINIE